VAPQLANGRVTLRQAAEAVLHAWDGVSEDGAPSLAVLRGPIDILCSVLTKQSASTSHWFIKATAGGDQAGTGAGDAAQS